MEYLYDLIVGATFLNIVVTMIFAILIEHRIDQLKDEIRKSKDKS
jgi:hypothetical protein